jgi:hypothetical protein
MFILFINIVMCWPFVNMDYRSDMFKIFFLMSRVYEIFVNVC